MDIIYVYVLQVTPYDFHWLTEESPYINKYNLLHFKYKADKFLHVPCQMSQVCRMQ